MSHPQFSDDNPKSNPWTEDRLGFTPFAQRLAASIIEVDAPNGYVIGLQGAWGSGKSTALNFVQSIIKKHNDELQGTQKPIHIIDFRPWIVSGHQDLIEAFFKIVTEQLADQKDAWSKRRKAGLRALRKNVDPLVDATAAIGSILAPGIGTLGGIGIKLATEAAKKSGSSKLDEWLAEPSLQSAYEKLRSRIVEQDEKILVIIDDIDRLTRAEIKTVMQMVKTLGRLPHVVYLLAYDRKIVWPALDDGTKHDARGPNFAEKIIQQEVELPKPSRHDLLGMLDTEIGWLTRDTEEDSRWYNIIVDGIHRWIKYPRDVARLSNAVKFTWPAVKSEVDPQDILAIEGIRLFDPIVFEWIRSNRDNMFEMNNWATASATGRAKLGDDFISTIGKEHQESIIRLLCALIPTIVKFFDKKSFYGLSMEPYYKVVNRRGIGSEAGYDTYFSLHPSDRAVSRRILDKALLSTTDLNAQLEIMNAILTQTSKNGRQMIGEYFQDLRYRITDFRTATAPISLMEACFEFAEHIHEAEYEAGAFMLSPDVNLLFLMTDLCKVVDHPELVQSLEKIFDSRSSICICAEFWTQRAGEVGLIETEGQSDASVLDEQALRRLSKKLVGRIEKAVEDGSIKQERVYYDIAKVLDFAVGDGAVRRWISNECHSDGRFLAKICKGMLAYTVGSKPRVYSMHNAPKEKYYDLKELYSAAEKHAADENLTADERSRIETLRTGLSRILARREQGDDSADPQNDEAGSDS